MGEISGKHGGKEESMGEIAGKEISGENRLTTAASISGKRTKTKITKTNEKVTVRYKQNHGQHRDGFKY